MSVQRFQVADAVRTRGTCTPEHTRLPQYLCGKRGRIEAVHGLVPLADERAHGGERAARAPKQALYTVVFAGHEVWGDTDEGGTCGGVTISADLWDGYLEPDEEAGR